jgi:hypothetical protein
VEVSFVRNKLKLALDRARRGSQDRRQRVAETDRAYTAFLNDVAVPVFRMLAMALKAEGLPFTVSTPGQSVRLSSDNARDDYIELVLDTSADPPEVTGRISRGRGSRTLTEELPVKAGASPDAIQDEDVLTFLLTALEPWLER